MYFCISTDIDIVKYTTNTIHFYFWGYFNLHKVHMTHCIHCTWDQIKKNGRLASWWQRRKCWDCKKQFSIWWARDTYTPEFKNKVTDEYCHTPSGAQKVIQKYGISSRTLISRKKKHIQDCDSCQQKVT